MLPLPRNQIPKNDVPETLAPFIHSSGRAPRGSCCVGAVGWKARFRELVTLGVGVGWKDTRKAHTSHCPHNEKHKAGCDYVLGRSYCRQGDQRKPTGVLTFTLGPDWRVRASQTQLWAKSCLGRTHSAKAQGQGRAWQGNKASTAW